MANRRLTIEEIEQRQIDIKYTLLQLKNAFKEANETANEDLIYQTIDLIEDMMDKIYDQDAEREEQEYENEWETRLNGEEDNTWSKGAYE